MIRKTLTILSLIGLLLSVGAWVMSYWRMNFRTEGHAVGILDGCLLVDSNPRTVFLDKRLGGFQGFRTIWEPFYRHYGCPMNNWFLGIPLWIPTTVFGALFMSVRPLPLHRRRKRKMLGLCVKCGYDLRASKDRCPECGEEFVSTGVER